MKKFLFAALAFASLVFVGCSDDKGVENKESYSFVSSHLSFNFNVKGDLAELVDVVSTTTLPATDGTPSSSSEGTKHTLFISNIKCPAEFDVTFTLKPKNTAVIDESKKYSYEASYDFTLTRNFSDNTHIVGSTGSSDPMSGTVSGKDALKFFELYGKNTFSFKLTHDGYVDETEEDNE